MANISISIFIMIGIASVIVVISLIAYNRRLDRIARGEIRDTHTALPEPGTTAGITYKVVLMALMILTVINVSTVSGLVIPMQNSINNLRSTNDDLYREINELHRDLAEQYKKASYSSWEPLSVDTATNTAELKLYVGLKEYSEDTKVSIDLNGGEIPLAMSRSGEFSTTVTAGIFDQYRDAKLLINDGGRIYTESFDFPEELFWEYLPMPSFQATFDSDYTLGKLSYSGSYSVTVSSRPEDINTATLTYMTSGRDLKTIDITDKIKTGEWIELDKGLGVDKDLSFKTEINTKDGFKITKTSVMIYAADGTEYKEGLTISDANGTVLYSEEE